MWVHDGLLLLLSPRFETMGFAPRAPQYFGSGMRIKSKPSPEEIERKIEEKIREFIQGDFKKGLLRGCSTNSEGEQ